MWQERKKDQRIRMNEWINKYWTITGINKQIKNKYQIKEWTTTTKKIQ